MGEQKKLRLRRKSNGTHGRLGDAFTVISLETAIEFSTQAAIATDSSSKIIALNNQALDLLGYSRSELIGASLDALISKRTTVSAATGETDTLPGDTAATASDLEARCKDGTAIPVTVRSRSVESDIGTATISNISKAMSLEQAENTIQVKRPRWQDLPTTNLLDMVPVAYHSLDQEGRIIEVNQAWLEKLDYSRAEVVGRWFGDFLSPEQAESFRRSFPLFIQRGYARSGELELLGKNGQRLVGSFECRAAYDERGQFACSHCTFSDITGQRSVEAALSESEERFRLLAEFSPDAILVHYDGKISFVNQAAVNLLGAADREELVGKSVLDFVHPDCRDMVQERLKELFASGQPTEFAEQKLVRLDSRAVEVEAASVRLPYMGRQAVQVVARDITERKAIEKALLASERRYRAIVQDQTEMVCRWTPDGRLTFVNDSCAQHLGKSPDELIGRDFLSVLPQSEDASTRHHFGPFTPEDPVQTHQHLVIEADGEPHWQQWSSRGLFDGDGQLFEIMSVGHDITRLKQVEQALHYRLKFEHIIMSLSSRFISVGPDQINDTVNEVLQTIGGFIGADRCYIIRTTEDGQTVDNSYEWCAEGIAPRIKGLQDVPTGGFPYCMKTLADGDVLHLPSLTELPEEAAEDKREIERLGIKSVLAVPTVRQGTLIGVLGIDSTRRERTWTFDEIALLKIVGETVMTTLERERTERALRSSEEKYRTFVQNFQGIAFQARMDWVPLFFHGAVEAITGYTEQEFTSGTPRWDEVIHPDDWDIIRDSAHKIATVPGYSVEREYRILRKDGGIRWLRELSQNTCDESGNPKLVQGAIYDITEKRRAAQALQESEERFRTMADFTYDWEYWLDTDDRFIYISPSCESTTGYSQREFMDDPSLLVKIVHPEDRQLFIEHRHDPIGKGRVTSIDFRISTRDGEERWINHVCQPVYGDNGRSLGRRASNRDITERKAAEEAVRRERDRAQRYLDVAGTIMLALDSSGRVILINRKGCEVLGYDETEVVGTVWLDKYVPGKARSEVRKTFDRMINGDAQTMEYHESAVLTRSGEERVIAWYNTLLRDEEGRVRGTLGSGLDITERMRMEQVQSTLFAISEATNLTQNLEELLQTIRQILGTLIDTTNFYVALYHEDDDSYTFPYIVDQYNESSPTSKEQLKKTLTDYVRRTGQPLLADGSIDKELEAAGEVEVVGKPSEVWLGVPLKTPRGVLGVVAVQSYTDPRLYQESDMDLMTFVSGHITMAIERKLADDALRESEQTHRSLVETMSEGLVIRDNDGIVTFANKRFCEMLGVTRHDILGSNLKDVLDDESFEEMMNKTQQRNGSSYESYELQWRRTDGDTITTIVSPEAVRDAEGRVTGSLSVITDISDWKRTEAKLRQATDLLRIEREALTQKNIALKEVLEHIEKERRDYKQQICQDVQRTVTPFMDKLKTISEGRKARDLDAMETQLDAVLARDVDTYRDRYATLTPRELEICDLIKAKQSSKEISERLNLSLLTVHKHREQIRRKLGLTSKGINLSTYLQSH